MKKNIFLDIETYSSGDLKLGVKNYINADDFTILTVAYALNDDPITVLDLTKDTTSTTELEALLADLTVRLIAHNANFEESCLSKLFTLNCQIIDTMAMATNAGFLNVSLNDLAKEFNTHKIEEGKELIKLFCSPLKRPTLQQQEDLADSTSLQEAYPDQWQQFLEYNKQDVEALRVIYNALPPLTDKEQRIWRLTQKINAHGWRINLPQIDKLIEIRDDNNNKQFYHHETGAEININSRKQVLDYAVELGITDLKGYTADDIKKWLQAHPEDSYFRDILIQRQSSSLSSLKKLDILKSGAINGRIYDYLKYQGAPATGRFSSKIYQIQNFARGNSNTSYDELFDKAASSTITNPEMTTLMRTCLIPDTPDDVLIISDYSQIEARVIAWFANQVETLEAFEQGKDLYKITAANMYNTEYNLVTKDQRQKGKGAVLGLGYGGGFKALQTFLPGTPDREAQEIVKLWRNTNPLIVEFWNDLENGVKALIENKASSISINGRLTIIMPKQGEIHFILPSGRNSVLRNVSVKYGTIILDNDFKKSLYGGKLANKVVQGFARDIMAEAMLRIDEAGFRINGTVHDEVVVSAPEQYADEITQLMTQHNYTNLPLTAETITSRYYRK